MRRMLLCCRRGCAPKLWQRRALEMLASLMLQPPDVPRAPAHIISTTMELGQAISWGSYILRCCLAAALLPRREASTGTPCHNTTSVLVVCQSTCTSVKSGSRLCHSGVAINERRRMCMLKLKRLVVLYEVNPPTRHVGASIQRTIFPQYPGCDCASKLCRRADIRR
jgi:hypothetical protein